MTKEDLVHRMISIYITASMAKDIGNVYGIANVNEEGETAALSTDDYYRISDYVRGWNIKMLNAYIRGQRKKRKQKLFDF